MTTYTRLLDPTESKQRQESGELNGVGIEIALDKSTQENIVLRAFKGAPAYQAGVQPQDVIISVNGDSTNGMTTDDVVNLLRGPEGTSVLLGLRRGDQIQKIRLKRTPLDIYISAINSSSLNTSRNGIKIGYIRIDQFNSNVSREFYEAINDLEVVALRALFWIYASILVA